MARDRRKKQRRSADNTTTKESRRRQNRRQLGDRRASRRIDLDLWVEQELGKEVCFRMAADLSTGGVRLTQGLSYPIGTSVRLKLPLPDGALEVAARVVGVSAGATVSNIEFLELGPDERVRINAFLDQVTERMQR